MAETRYTIRPDYKGPIAALSLAMALLRKSKTRDWAELTESLDNPESPAAVILSKVTLDEEQIELLDTNAEYLQYLKNDPPVQVAVCDCGLPYLVASGAAPTTCLADPKCKGKPVKPVAATITKPEKLLEELATDAGLIGDDFG